MYINGEWITNAEKTFPVFNPATGEKIGEVADGNATHANNAIEAAHTAFQTWSKPLPINAPAICTMPTGS